MTMNVSMFSNDFFVPISLNSPVYIGPRNIIFFRFIYSISILLAAMKNANMQLLFNKKKLFSSARLLTIKQTCEGKTMNCIQNCIQASVYR